MTIGMSLVILLATALPSASGCTREKMYRIGYTQIVSHPALDQIHDAFVEVMAQEGFIEGANVQYDYSIPDGDITVAKAIADKFVAEKVDMICPITTISTQSICVAAKDSGIPIVFASVTDPIGAGIVPSWENPCSPGLKVTGLSDFVPVEPQLDLVKEICPDAEVLGMVFNTGDGSTTKTVEQMRRLAPEYGLGVVEANVSTSAEVHSAAMSLVGRADVAWIPMCNTTVTALEALVSVCEEKDIPLFVPDRDSVKRGGIACAYYSNYELGEQQAKKAIRVLGGEDPCGIPVTTYTSIADITVSPGAAERMGATIPQSLLDRATEVIEE